MSSVLSQSEVDSLLAALEPAAIPRNPLLAGNRSAQDGARDSSRVGADALRMLERVHERFAVELGQELGNLLAAAVDVKPAGVDQLTWGECAGGLDNPGCLAMLATDPPTADFLIDIEPALAFPIVDRLLGGPGKPLPMHARRALTEIELRLLSRVAEMAGTAIAKAWQGIRECQPKVMQIETDPQCVRFAAPEASIVLARFDVCCGEIAGSLGLGLPAAAIERLIGEAANRSNLEPSTRRAATDAGDGDASRTRMIVQLATTRLSLEETAHLEVGDVIVTECDQARPLTVLLDGTPRFAGFAGLVKDRKAVQIGAALDAVDGGLQPQCESSSAGESPIQSPARD